MKERKKDSDCLWKAPFCIFCSWHHVWTSGSCLLSLSLWVNTCHSAGSSRAFSLRHKLFSCSAPWLPWTKKLCFTCSSAIMFFRGGQLTMDWIPWNHEPKQTLYPWMPACWVFVLSNERLMNTGTMVVNCMWKKDGYICNLSFSAGYLSTFSYHHLVEPLVLRLSD